MLIRQRDSYTIQWLSNSLLLQNMRCDGIYVGDNYVTKDHGDYIEVCIDADNGKGHVSYDLYFDDNGNLAHWERHN